MAHRNITQVSSPSRGFIPATRSNVSVVFRLNDTAGLPVVDPVVYVNFRHKSELIDSTTGSFHEVGRYQFRIKHPLGETVHYSIHPSLYHHAARKSLGRVKPGDELHRTIELRRDRRRWDVEFTPWEALPHDEFAPLKRVLEASSRIRAPGGHGPIIGKLTGAGYDAIHGLRSRSGADTAALALAKTSMLNLFIKMSTLSDPTTAGASSRRPWFSYVREIVAVDRDRMIATVDPAMQRSLEVIQDNSDVIADYHGANPSLHKGNVPAGYTLDGDLLSIKSEEKRGNVQLTLVPARDGANHPVLLLDADIDRCGDLIGHFFEVAANWAGSGGTHPFDIHEYLRQESRIEYPGRDFGYSLVPRGEG